MNWLTRNYELEYRPILSLRDTDAGLACAVDACYLRTQRARVRVTEIPADMYHGSDETQAEMLARWRDAP